MAANPYWWGSIKVVLTRSDVSTKCKWAHGDHSANRLALVNLAFAMWRRGRRTILHCSHDECKERMTEALEEAGTAGWNDLCDACDHLWSRASETPWWSDTATIYASFPGWVSGRYEVPAVSGNLPDGPVNFLNRTAEQLEELKETALEKYLPRLDKVIKAFKASNYDGAIEALKGVQEKAETIDSWLWIAPAKIEATMAQATKVVSYSNVVTDFDDFLSDVDKYRNTGFDEETSLAMAALKKAVGIVPVFGQFYQAALDVYPSLIGNFKQMCEERQQKLLDLARSS